MEAKSEGKVNGVRWCQVHEGRFVWTVRAVRWSYVFWGRALYRDSILVDTNCPSLKSGIMWSQGFELAVVCGWRKREEKGWKYVESRRVDTSEAAKDDSRRTQAMDGGDVEGRPEAK